MHRNKCGWNNYAYNIFSTCVINKLLATGLWMHTCTWNKESIITCKLATSLGDSKFFSILSSVNDRTGSIDLVHIEDICNAHIFFIENDRAEGQYMKGFGDWGKIVIFFSLLFVSCNGVISS